MSKCILKIMDDTVRSFMVKKFDSIVIVLLYDFQSTIRTAIIG